MATMSFTVSEDMRKAIHREAVRRMGDGDGRRWSDGAIVVEALAATAWWKAREEGVKEEAKRMNEEVKEKPEPPKVGTVW